MQARPARLTLHTEELSNASCLDYFAGERQTLRGTCRTLFRDTNQGRRVRRHDRPYFGPPSRSPPRPKVPGAVVVACGSTGVLVSPGEGAVGVEIPRGSTDTLVELHNRLHSVEKGKAAV